MDDTTTSDLSSVQEIATRMIPEKVRWGLLLALFVLQALVSALLSAAAAVGWGAPEWLSFAAAFLLAVSSPITLLAAVNVNKQPAADGTPETGTGTDVDA